MASTQTDQTEPVNGPFIGAKSRLVEIQQRNGIVFSFDGWEGYFFPDTVELSLHHIDANVAGVYYFEIDQGSLYAVRYSKLFTASDGSALDSIRAKWCESLFIMMVERFQNSSIQTIIRAIRTKK